MRLGSNCSSVVHHSQSTHDELQNRTCEIFVPTPSLRGARRDSKTSQADIGGPGSVSSAQRSSPQHPVMALGADGSKNRLLGAILWREASASSRVALPHSPPCPAGCDFPGASGRDAGIARCLGQQGCSYTTLDQWVGMKRARDVSKAVLGNRQILGCMCMFYIMTVQFKCMKILIICIHSRLSVLFHSHGTRMAFPPH